MAKGTARQVLLYFRKFLLIYLTVNYLGGTCAFKNAHLVVNVVG